MTGPLGGLVGTMRGISDRQQIGVAAIGLSLVLAACTTTAASETTSTTSRPSTTTTTMDPTVAEFEADVALIHDLWWGETLAFGMGFEEGIGYWVDHNYPAMGCTYNDYMRSWYPEGPVEGLLLERTANEPTILADEGWVIPGGTLEGEVADGRVYVMSVRTTSTEPGAVIEEPSIRDRHVSIIDGEAHFFIGCGA